MHKMPYLNGSLLRLVILIPDELQELRGAGLGGPHAPHGLMILHFFSNLSQQPRLQNVLGHLWQSLLSSIYIYRGFITTSSEVSSTIPS